MGSSSREPIIRTIPVNAPHFSADSDHTAPWAIANASYKREKRNKGVTQIVKMPGRGHSLTIDAGWREVAEKALEFVKRFT
jgi:non-heme chloroperoxidase